MRVWRLQTSAHPILLMQTPHFLFPEFVAGRTVLLQKPTFASSVSHEAHNSNKRALISFFLANASVHPALHASFPPLALDGAGKIRNRETFM
jgi:hypothetical protein